MEEILSNPEVKILLEVGLSMLLGGLLGIPFSFFQKS